MKFAIFYLITLTYNVGGSEFRIVNIDKCKGHEKYLIIEQCEASGIIVNAKAQFISTIDTIIIYKEFYRKTSDNKYQRIFKNLPPIDWCKICSSKSQSAGGHLLLLAKTKFPEFAKPCPWEPFELVKVNMTLMDKKIFDFMPTGVFRFKVIARNNRNETMFEIAVVFELF